MWRIMALFMQSAHIAKSPPKLAGIFIFCPQTELNGQSSPPEGDVLSVKLWGPHKLKPLVMPKIAQNINLDC